MSRLTIILLGAAIIGIVIFMAYGEITGFYFTDVDTFSLIHHGRFENFNEFKKIFTTELMAGKMVNAVYFRPITSLTFGAIYHFFQLNATYYHFIHLVLFFLTSLLIFLIASKILPGSRGLGIALLASLLFAIHPLQVDNVPAIARLGDLLAGFFTAFSLYLFLLFIFPKKKSSLHYLAYIFSILTALLGLASKEPAILATVMIPVTAFIFSKQFAKSKTQFWKRAYTSTLYALPYIICSGLFLVWRAKIIGGAGGYASEDGILNDSQALPIAFRLKSVLWGHIFGFILNFIGDFDRYYKTGLSSLAFIFPMFGLSLYLGRKKISYFWKVIREPFGGEQDILGADQRLYAFSISFLILHAGLLFFTVIMLRYLYLSTIPFCLFASLFLFRFYERLKNMTGLQQWLAPALPLFYVPLRFGIPPYGINRDYIDGMREPKYLKWSFMKLKSKLLWA